MARALQGARRTRDRGGETAPPDRLKLLNLVATLADESEWEVPGDIGAPPFYYTASGQAAGDLKGHAHEVLPELAEVMRRSIWAAHAGMQLLAECGDDAVPLLLEMLRHPDRRVRSVALGRVRDQVKSSPAHEDTLVQALWEGLLDPETSYKVVGELPYVKTALRPTPAYLERLAAGLRARTAHVEAGHFFAEHAGVREALTDLAAQGNGAAASILGRHSLAELDADKLCQGVLTPELVTLLGQLGERAEAARPRLAELPPDTRTVVALMKIPGGWAHAEPHVKRLFLEEDERGKAALIRWHPNPGKLADEVLGTLRQRQDLRGMSALGAYAADQLPWLRTFLQPYGDKLRCWDALNCIAQFGEQARPAFAALAALLDHTEHRGSVLRALTLLGPVAREEFLPLLEVLELESQRWLVWQHNYWDRTLAEALAALRRT
jgi:hypothetical protein